MFKLEANLNEEILDREVGTTGYDISKKEWITSSFWKNWDNLLV